MGEDGGAVHFRQCVHNGSPQLLKKTGHTTVSTSTGGNGDILTDSGGAGMFHVKATPQEPLPDAQGPIGVDRAARIDSILREGPGTESHADHRSKQLSLSDFAV